MSAVNQNQLHQSNATNIPRDSILLEVGHVLLLGRESGLMSPRRTTFSACSLSAKLRKRERLIFPTGRRSARRRTGAIGERGSIPMVASICCGAETVRDGAQDRVQGDWRGSRNHT